MALSLKDAADYLGITEALLKNLINNSKEIPSTRRSNRYQLEKEDLDTWLNNRDRILIRLDLEDYRRALEFAFKINYSGHTTSDFGTARQRGILKAISDWTQGALAEIAFQKFIQRNHQIVLELDFSVHDFIIGQDITSVRRGRVENPPRIRVSIKSGKLNSCFIIIGNKEYELPERSSDYYVFVRLNFPEDHLIRALKDHEIISEMNIPIPDLGQIDAFIEGYINKEELERVRSIPGQNFESDRYVKNVGALLNSVNDWNNFVNLL